jgi:hypothetical protein
LFYEGVPGGEAGAGERCRLVVGEVGGGESEGVFGEDEVLGERAGDDVAECVERLLGGGGAVDPAGAVVGDDSVADLEARGVGAEGDDLADGVGNLGDGELKVRIVGSVVEELVAVVEGDGGDADEGFAGAGRGLGDVVEGDGTVELWTRRCRFVKCEVEEKCRSFCHRSLRRKSWS